MADNNSRIDLYALLPETYRTDDAGQGYALRALMDLMSAQANLVKDDVAGLYDDLFIETCAEWVIPYIGDLVANNPLHEAVRGRRADVAKTIYYRRRKGTLPMLEELARDVTGWSAHAVAFFEQLGWTQNLNHLRVTPAPNAAGADPDASNRVGTAHVRNIEAMDLLDGAFDITTHTVDVRRIRRYQGWYNIRKIGFFLWRLESYPLDLVDPRQSTTHPHGWHFDTVGCPAPLFTRPEPELSETGLSSEIHVKTPIRPLAFGNDIAAARGFLPRPESSVYFGKNRSIGITVDAVDLRPIDVTPQDLGAWERPPAAFSGIFSGVLAAPNIASAAAEVGLTIAGDGPHAVRPLPSGPGTIAAIAAALEDSIRRAAPSRAFAGVRVVPVGNRLLVIPGVRGAALVFAATAADATTVTDLLLNAPTAASGVMSGDLTVFPVGFAAAPQLEVTMGANPPQSLTLAAAPVSVADAASKIATAVNAVAFPEFAAALVIPLGSRLLILPGVDGAIVRVRTTPADVATAEALRLTNKVGVDVRLGRFAFPLGGEPAATSRVQATHSYGFSAGIGGGPYDRRQRPPRLGEAAVGRLDNVRYPGGTVEFRTRWIRIPTDQPTIPAAIAAWNPVADPTLVIEIDDNRTLVGNLAINIPSGELILQGRNGRRPTVLGDIDVTAAGGTGRFQMNGIRQSGRLAVHGSLGELRIVHSTLVPGLGRDESGNASAPDAPSLVVDPSNVHLRVVIVGSVVGSVEVPNQVQGMEIRDSIVDTSRAEGRAVQVPVWVSGAFAPFPVPPAPPRLRVTIGDDGPIIIQLAGIPANHGDARQMLEAALRAASPAPGFAGAGVLSRGDRLYIMSGSNGRVAVQEAPGDTTATQWRLIASDARESFGLLSGDLVAPVALTNPAPTLDLVIGTPSARLGPRTVSPAGFPAAVPAAAVTLETAIRAAGAEPEFTGTEVFAIGSRLLVLPGGDGASATFVFRPADPTSLVELELESARPSVAGGPGGDQPAPPVVLENVTVFGACHFREITLASNVIFQGIARSDRRQEGCVRFSYITPGSRVPRRYRCQPDLAIENISDPILEELARTRIRPSYTSARHGDPGYAQLAGDSACKIKTGAENESEMGAFNLLLQPQREANLRIRLEEYLPFGLEPGLIYLT